MRHDMPKPCKFSSLDSCQKRFLWAQKEVEHSLHTAIGLTLQVGDAEKFSQVLGLESLYIFLGVRKQVHVSQP